MVLRQASLDLKYMALLPTFNKFVWVCVPLLIGYQVKSKGWQGNVFLQLLLQLGFWDKLSHWTWTANHTDGPVLDGLFFLPSIPTPSTTAGITNMPDHASALKSSCLHSQYFTLWITSPTIFMSLFVHMTQSTCGDRRPTSESQLSPFIVWIPAIERQVTCHAEPPRSHLKNLVDGQSSTSL